MKANQISIALNDEGKSRYACSLLVLVAAALATLAASCSDKRIIPVPTPTSAPPAPATAARCARRDHAPQASDRLARRMPINRGQLGMEQSKAGRSTARFAGGVLGAPLRSQPAVRVTLLTRGAGARPGPGPLPSRTTSARAHAFGHAPARSRRRCWRSTLAPHAIRCLTPWSFSRGRFMVDRGGTTRRFTYPSWPEDRAASWKTVVEAKTGWGITRRRLLKLTKYLSREGLLCIAECPRYVPRSRRNGRQRCRPSRDRRRLGSTARKEVIRCLMVQQRGRQFP